MTSPACRPGNPLPITLYNTLTRPQGALRADRPGERAHVRLRADGLRLRAHRQRPPGRRLRRAVPPAAARLRRRSTSPTRATSPTSTTRSTRARPRRSVADRRAHRAHDRASSTRTWPRSARCRRRHEPRATEHIAEMVAHDRDAVARGPRLRGGGPRAVRCRLDAGLRPPLATAPRRDGGGRARRGRALQARPDGLRAVEAVEARRAGLADARAASPRRAARLAHRVLGRWSAEALLGPRPFDIHGGGIDLVFPHHENEIAQSRCAHGTPVARSGCTTASCRSKARRCRSRSATSSRSTTCWTESGRARSIALALLTHALPPADRLDGEGADRGARARSTELAGADGGRPDGSPRARTCSRRSRTTSTRRGVRGRARLARSGDGGETGGGVPEGLGAAHGPATTSPEALARVAAGVAADRRRAGGRAGGGPAGGAQGEELRGGRPHPRRARGQGIALKDGKDPATGQPVTMWEVRR